MPIIVDAYNYLYARAGLEDMLPIRDFNAARTDMLEFLEKYRRTVRRKIIVVIDGKHAKGMGAKTFGGLDIVYAGKDADTAIEEIVERAHGRKQTLVVSSDRAVKKAVKRLGATPIGSGEFHKMAAKELERRKRKHPPEPRQKYHPPSKAEVDYWLKKFTEPDEKR